MTATFMCKLPRFQKQTFFLFTHGVSTYNFAFMDQAVLEKFLKYVGPNDGLQRTDAGALVYHVFTL